MHLTTLAAPLAAAVAEHGRHAAPATGVFSITWLIVALPLIGAGILLFGGRRTDRWGHLLACALPTVSFLIALAQFATMLGKPGGQRAFDNDVFSFIPVAAFQVHVGFLVDPLSMVFVLLITCVGTLIHIYSIGYMAHDPDRRRFFGYLNLFVAAMLLLVLADDYVVLYVGWEGVGLASYLLIGFWQYKPVAATAAKKAFIVNRVGDFGLTLAILLMFSTFGATSFAGIFPHAGGASSGAVTWIGLLLLLGACAKSAQVPLQSWLLDAMEGPTPVSALIHAATMVTAGVYLIVRSNPIFDLSPTARLAVTIVGAVTLIVGAIIGCAKDDIKKGLAGSTMSQIGYMILGAGLGPIGYVFAIAHLLAHGFFKAALFLGAGSVMHATNDEVDMRRYGGLRKLMPVTYVTFGLAYLAIIGLPPFAGYWTKDKIVEAAFAKGGTSGTILGIAALVGAGITAYYMTRMMILTFFGEPRWDSDVHPHESPRVMTWPIIALSVGSVAGGAFLIIGDRLGDFLKPVTGNHEGSLPIPAWGIALITLGTVVAGMAVAYLQYIRRTVPRVAPAGNAVVVAARRDLYGDAINESLFMRPGQYLSRILVFFDNRGVDGTVNGLAAIVGGSSGRLRRIQTGFVRSYALSMFVGAAAVVCALLLVRI